MSKKIGVALVAAALLAPCVAGAEEFPAPVLESLEKALGIYEQVRVRARRRSARAGAASRPAARRRLPPDGGR